MCSVFALCSHHWVVLVDVLVASGNTGQKAVLSFFLSGLLLWNWKPWVLDLFIKDESFEFPIFNIFKLQKWKKQENLFLAETEEVQQFFES